MFYIPKDWLIDQSNEEDIHAILNRHLFSDINPDLDLVIKELESIGETTVIERIKDGTLTLD